MLSRVADSVFWLFRYLERAENVARFVDVNHNLMLDVGEHLDANPWAPLIYATGDHERFLELYPEATSENVLRFLTFDPKNPNSILSCVRSARENARRVREIISTAMWEEINKLHARVTIGASESLESDEIFAFCDKVRLATATIVGVTDSTMSHGEAWHFGALGRLIERADKTSRLVDVKYYILLPDPTDVGSSLDIVQWSALLRSASALQMYRKAHGRILPIKVADFLLLDRDFPRSVRFCIRNAQQSLGLITGTMMGNFSNLAEQQLGRLTAQLDYSDIEDVFVSGLHEYIDSLQGQINDVGDAIFQSFFTLTDESSDEANSKFPATQVQTQT